MLRLSTRSMRSGAYAAVLLIIAALLAPRAAAATETFEVCGVGRVPVDELGRLPPMPTPSLDALLDRMANSDKADERAVGLINRHAVTTGRAQQSALASCQADPQCEKNARAAAQAAGAADAALLQAHALQSRDRTARALALHLCDWTDWRDRTCQAEAAAQWVEVDQDNVLAWLALAGAKLRSPDQLDAAIAGAAKARRAEHYYQRRTVTLGPEATPFEQMTVLGFAANATVFLDYSAIIEGCSAKALQDPLRRAQCSSILTVMAEQDTTFAGRLVALGIGVHRLGWPAEREVALRALLNAERELVERVGRENMFACDTMQEMYRHLLDVARYGEIEAARLRVQRSGLSIEELAAAEHRRRAELARQLNPRP
jgi:hypothetical protein